MNENTLVSIQCYQGDESRVREAWPLYTHHECPLIVLSPTDSRVVLPGADYRFGGKTAYDGEASLIRQHFFLECLSQFPFEYFFLNDSDSFCLTPELPREVYQEGVIWSNEVVEPRPHPSPYPKIAMQAPYFLSRKSLQKLVAAIPKIPLHPITPFIDYLMVAASCEAGLKHVSFESLDQKTSVPLPKPTPDNWGQLAWRIRHRGAVFMHPIKTAPQIELCLNARRWYEEHQAFCKNYAL